MDGPPKAAPPLSAEGARSAGGPRSSSSRQSGHSETQSSDQIARELGRGGSTSSRHVKEKSLDQASTQKEIAQNVKRYNYLSQVFSMEEPYDIAYDEVKRESVVVLEIKTNKKVEDARLVTIKLAQELEPVFHHKILITMDHSASLVFGSPTQHAYLVTVSALASLLTPLCNNRYAAVVQRQLNEHLGIPAHSGLIKFNSLPEDDIGTHGKTYKSAIVEREKSIGGGSSRASVSRSGSHSLRRTLRDSPRESTSGSLFRRLTLKSNSSTKSRPALQKEAVVEKAEVAEPAQPERSSGPQSPGSEESLKEAVIRKCKSLAKFNK